MWKTGFRCRSNPVFGKCQAILSEVTDFFRALTCGYYVNSNTATDETGHKQKPVPGEGPPHRSLQNVAKTLDSFRYVS
jgi:hypothetical protein